MAGKTVRQVVKDTIAIDLAVRELEVLAQIADYHQRSMGPMRHMVRLTAPSVRSRFRFLDQESTWLRRFAEASRADLVGAAKAEATVDITPRAAVAWAGRLLASVHSRRARRKLSPQEIDERDQLASKLCQALGSLDPNLVDAELRLRRPDEAAWIRERLAAE